MNKKIWCLVVLVLGLAGLADGAEGGGVVVQMEKSVLMIRGVSQDYDYRLPWKQKAVSQGTGTGFVIAGNRILTNAHNVSNNKYVEVKKQDQAKRYPARVVFIGHDCDLAILQIDEPGFYDDMVALELGGVPKVNTTVQTYGFPMGGKQMSVTEGVISRVEMDIYSHTGADSHLVVQTDAAINPGNSGGPVMQEGKVVGVAFQGLRQGDNIGYMIPTPVIRHFLDDIEDDKYDMFGSLGFAFFAGLHSESYKEYLKVPEEKEGIVVLRTVLNSSVENVLRRNDVITKIDDYDIDNDGKIWIDGLHLQMSEVIERKQIGDKIKLTFYRDGQVTEGDVEIRVNRPVLGYSRQYDKKPEYVVYAGLTFVTLTRNLLEAWGGGWLNDIPQPLRYLFYYSTQLNQDRERRQYVVLAEILADEVNAYYQGFVNLPVESIDDKEIWSLEDVDKALREQKEGYCVIKFMGSDRPLILDVAKCRSRHDSILKQYEVPVESYLESR